MHHDASYYWTEWSMMQAFFAKITKKTLKTSGKGFPDAFLSK